MIFRVKAYLRLFAIGLPCSLFVAGCGDKTSSSHISQQRTAANSQGEDSPLADDDDASAVTSADEHKSSTADAVMRLLTGIPTLPPIVENSAERSPICGAKDIIDSNGLCPVQETVENGGLAFVCSAQKFRLEKVPESFVALNPNADTLWPGSLIQSKSLMSGVLDPVPVADRSAGDITMTIATGASGALSGHLDKPSLATSTEAMRKILNDNVNINTPAKFYYKMSRVYSKQQLAIAMGVKVDTNFNLEVAASFDFDSTDEQNRILLEFTQEYYTIAFSPLNGLNGFFRDSVEPGDRTPYMHEGNPLAYISSVTYGRKIYLLFESKAKMTDLEVALAASFEGYGVKVSGDLKVQNAKILNETRIRAYMIGGNADAALDSLSSGDSQGNSVVNLKKLLTEGANFSKGNAGVPISFTVRHVKDSSQIKVQLVTEYSARECYPANEVGQPVMWDLKVTLQQIEIDKEGSQFCEPPLNDEGEFSTCLNVQVGLSGTPQSVFCSSDIRKAKAGDKLIYGQENHSTIISVAQKPGEKILVTGVVKEQDFADNFEEILNFHNTFELSQNYEWSNFKPEIVTSGVKNGCKATLHYSMEWATQR